MKVVILAGGYGSRLGKITESIPKPMVKIGGKPILWHIMNYYSSFGHKEFIICLGYKGESIKNYFYNFELNNSDLTINLETKNIDFHSTNKPDWKVTLVDTGITTLKGGRIKNIEKYLDEENFLTYGDGLSTIDLDALRDFHVKHGKILTISGVHPPSKFGEMEVGDNNVVRSFIEKPQTTIGLINGGYMVFKKKMLNYLSETGDLEIGPFDEMAIENEIMMFEHNGFWQCMDNERDVELLNKLWNEDKAPWRT